MTGFRLPMTTLARDALPPVVALPMALDLQLYAGDDFYLDLTVTNPDGTDADLTSALATAQIRSTPAQADPPLAVFTATIAGNVIHLHLPHSEAAKLTSSGVWDCQIATPDVATLVAGKVTVAAEVTRP